ncbi:MAG TPA: MBG domain-containing protein, partial [Geobacteraceae bacterium]|nr:MBG domain-containing protein [Geobacteraceae bacterium]
GANLTIDPANLTVTAAAKSKIYGAVDPALTYTASGFLNGDTNAIMTGSLTRAAGESVANYAISQGSVAATTNYTIAYTGANLTIDPAALTVTANDQTKTQGSVNPPLTIAYSGFVNGDTETSLTTQPTATTTATTESPAGSYPIIPDGGVSGNYTFNYVVGTLTVTAAGNPTLNVTISGNGSVNSNPSGIACTSGTCSNNTDFTNNQSVDLTASTSWNYDFTGWSGACSGTTNPCTVTVNGITDVTATFTAKQLVKMPGGNYPSIQEAYAAANEGETMQLRDQNFPGDLDFNRPVQVKLDGGWNTDYTAVTGNTTITGTVTVIDGGITASNLIIQ